MSSSVISQSIFCYSYALNNMHLGGFLTTKRLVFSATLLDVIICGEVALSTPKLECPTYVRDMEICPFC